jgi:hypothetical protein
MVDIVQLVRTSDCGSEGRGFESHCPPKNNFFKVFNQILQKVLKKIIFLQSFY